MKTPDYLIPDWQDIVFEVGGNGEGQHPLAVGETFMVSDGQEK